MRSKLGFAESGSRDHTRRAERAGEFIEFTSKVSRMDIAGTTHLVMGSVAATVSTVYGGLFQVTVHDGAQLLRIARRKTRSGALDHAYEVMFGYCAPLKAREKRVRAARSESKRSVKARQEWAIDQYINDVQEINQMKQEVLELLAAQNGRKPTPRERRSVQQVAAGLMRDAVELLNERRRNA